MKGRETKAVNPNVLAALQILLHKLKVCFFSLCGAGCVGKETNTQFTPGKVINGACLFRGALLPSRMYLPALYLPRRNLSRFSEPEAEALPRGQDWRALAVPGLRAGSVILHSQTRAGTPYHLGHFSPALQGTSSHSTAFVSCLVVPCRIVEFACLFSTNFTAP